MGQSFKKSLSYNSLFLKNVIKFTLLLLSYISSFYMDQRLLSINGALYMVSIDISNQIYHQQRIY